MVDEYYCSETTTTQACLGYVSLGATTHMQWSTSLKQLSAICRVALRTPFSMVTYRFRPYGYILCGMSMSSISVSNNVHFKCEAVIYYVLYAITLPLQITIGKVTYDKITISFICFLPLFGI